MKQIVTLASQLEKFFTVRLIQQRQVSPHTVSSYRDSFRQFLKFASESLGRAPSQIGFEQVDAALVTAFLENLEQTRNVSVRTRNLRLTAIHSLFQFAAYELPTHSAQIQRVLAIPNKRFDRQQIGFLNRDEVDALLQAPDQHSWSGRRDHAFILTAVQTGLRVSEITGLKRENLMLETGAGAHVWVMGKGRKARSMPLASVTCKALKAWLQEPQRGCHHVVFPNRMGEVMTVDGVQYLLRKHQATAIQQCSSLKDKRISVHVLRHTAAMEMLQSGIDRTTIALWLGHESIDTTQVYIEATLAMKENALAKMTPHKGKLERYRADDSLMEFLNNLG